MSVTYSKSITFALHKEYIRSTYHKKNEKKKKEKRKKESTYVPQKKKKKKKNSKTKLCTKRYNQTLNIITIKL